MRQTQSHYGKFLVRLRWLSPETGLLLAVISLIVISYLFHSPINTFMLHARLLGLLAAVIGGLCYIGFGLTWFFRSWRLLPMLPLFTPIIGLSGLLVVGHALAYLPMGTDQLAWPILGLFTIMNALAWWQGARPRLTRDHGLALFAGAVAVLLCLLPLHMLGYITTTGGSIDSIYYLVRAEFRQTHGLALLPPATSLTPPFIGHIRTVMSIREGDTFLLAFFSSLLNLRPHFIYPAVLAMWFGLTAVGTFVIVRGELRLHRLVALAISLLVAVHTLVHTPVLNNGLSQSGGVAIWTFTLLAVLAALRRGSWRTILLAGLLISTLNAIYPPYVIYMVPVVGLLLLVGMVSRIRANWPAQRWQAVRQHLGTAIKRGLALVVTTILVMPVAWLFFLNHAILVENITGRDVMQPRGDIRDFPHFGELFGVINHSEAVYHWGMPQMPTFWASVLLAVCLAFSVYALVRGTWSQCWLFLSWWLVFGAGLLHLRFWLIQGQGDAYLYYKVISLFAPFAMIVLGAGMFFAARDAARLPRIPRYAAWSGIAILFVSLLAIASFHTRTTIMRVGEGSAVIATDNILELEEANEYLPADAPLVIVDQTNPGQIWIGHILDRPAIYYRQQPRSYWTPTQSYSDERITYALIGHYLYDWQALPREPWFNEESHEVLWQNDSYALLRRTDATVAALPFALGNIQATLAAPVHLAFTAETLTLHGDAINAYIPLFNETLTTERFVQHLAGTPTDLMLLIGATQPGTLMVEYDNGTREQIALEPGTHEVVLPVAADTALHLASPEGASLVLQDVRALGAPEAQQQAEPVQP